MSDRDERPGFASPPCYAAELEPDHRAPPKPQTVDVDALRCRAKPAHLVAARLAVSAEDRLRVARQAADDLDRVL